MDWMLVAGNIFSVETRISDYLFCSWSTAWWWSALPMLGGLELAW